MSEFEELHEQIARLQTWNAKKQLQLNEVAERLNASVGPEYRGVHLFDAVDNELKKLRDELTTTKAERDSNYQWAVEMKAELDALKDAARWIPVEERMPEVTKWVSDYVQISPVAIGSGVRSGYVDEACLVPEDWHTEDFNYPAGWYRHNQSTPITGMTVTHWRPLPAPPEGEA